MSDALPDSYLTAVDGEEIETKVKGSHFLSRVFGDFRPEKLEELLTPIAKTHHSATHHCWAWACGLGKEERERVNDDGEPSGSAGAPILAAIKGSGLSDVFVVVTRYFGGTKLGRGGLVRAYGDSAAIGLEAVERREVWLDRSLSLHCGYGDVGAVEAILSGRPDDLAAVERDFGAEPRFDLRVRRSRTQSLVDALVEATAGRCRIEE